MDKEKFKSAPIYLANNWTLILLTKCVVLCIVVMFKKKNLVCLQSTVHRLVWYPRLITPLITTVLGLNYANQLCGILLAKKLLNYYLLKYISVICSAIYRAWGITSQHICGYSHTGVAYLLYKTYHLLFMYQCLFNLFAINYWQCQFIQIGNCTNVYLNCSASFIGNAISTVIQIGNYTNVYLILQSVTDNVNGNCTNVSLIYLLSVTGNVNGNCTNVCLIYLQSVTDNVNSYKLVTVEMFI